MQPLFVVILLERYALVGAGAVVTKNVPSFALVLGNPAQIVGWVDKKGKKIIFDKNNISKCGNYELDNIKNILTFTGS